MTSSKVLDIQPLPGESTSQVRSIARLLSAWHPNEKILSFTFLQAKFIQLEDCYQLGHPNENILLFALIIPDIKCLPILFFLLLVKSLHRLLSILLNGAWFFPTPILFWLIFLPIPILLSLHNCRLRYYTLNSSILINQRICLLGGLDMHLGVKRISFISFMPTLSRPIHWLEPVCGTGLRR